MITSVCCLGAGYVGAPSLAIFAQKNPSITFYVLDISQQRIDAWNSQQLPIYEPGLQEVIEQVRDKNLFFSTNIAEIVPKCEIIFVCVNTPTKQHGIGGGHALDISIIESAARMIAPMICENQIIVEKSTVPVHTAHAIQEILEKNTERNFAVLSNPEFLAEGTAIYNLENPSRVLIGGSNQEAIETLRTLYYWIPNDKILTMGIWSSELSKLVANAFLAQRISSINTIAALCEKTGASVTDVARSIRTDPRIGPMFLEPSVGFGGSCFHKDLSCLVYLCRNFHLDEEANYWEQVLNINALQRTRFVKNISEAMYHSLSNKVFIMLGFAFKKNTGDTRESSAIDIANQLLNENAILRIYDPQVQLEDIPPQIRNSNRVTFYQRSMLETIAQNSDAILIVTEWDEFKELPYESFYCQMRKPSYLFDGRRIIHPGSLRKIGFHVYQIGDPAFKNI